MFRLVCLSLLGLSLLTSSCKHEVVAPQERDQYRYLFLGHTYQWHSPHDNNRIDHRLEDHNFRQYDGILLGGDMCSETTKFPGTVEYLDGLFGLSAQPQLWSVGNHDVRNGNLHYITNATKRPLYYSSTHHGTVWIVMNTVVDMATETDICLDKAEQMQMFDAVLDTISSTSNLVLLTHYVVWGKSEPDMEARQLANTDASWFDFLCDSVSGFETLIYPRLISHAEKGAQVYVISGDGGQYSKTYEYEAKEGLRFLISGINNSVDTTIFSPSRPYNHEPDSVLLLYNDRISNTLSHEFVSLEKLVN